MMQLLKCSLLCLCLLGGFQAMGQDDDYANDKHMRYDDWIYNSNIKTVQLYESTWEFAPALINLNSGQQLMLSFDDLDRDKKSYSISFIHCDANWEPSDLMISEYINGFYDANILNFGYSNNTLQTYTHYSIVFPSTNVQFTKSGNYIVYVYLNGDKNDLVITRRFMVADNKVTVVGTIRQAAGNDEQFLKQHIDFNIINSSYPLINPYSDLKVVITQNNRWDNAVTGIKPTFVEPTQLTYSLDDASTFNGGNEFRYFDTRSLRTYTERVKNIYKDSLNRNHVELLTDELRTFKRYFFYNDINGSFLINNTDLAIDMTTDADYVWVNFFFPYDNPVSDGNFYVLGKLTNWRLGKENRMTYNYKRFGYECNLYLKQGYYNYTYVYAKDGEKGGDETMTEGNHWDTENDYTIYVYYRQRSTYYDQLIAIKRMNSIKR